MLLESLVPEPLSKLASKSTPILYLHISVHKKLNHSHSEVCAMCLPVQFDGAMAQRASAAEAANQVIRYVGSVDVANGTAAIKVSRYVVDTSMAYYFLRM